MRVIAILLMLTVPALAVGHRRVGLSEATCTMLRAAVAAFGLPFVENAAKARGYTPAQVRGAHASCRK